MTLEMDSIFNTDESMQDEFFQSVADQFLKPSLIIKQSDETVVSSTALHNDAELIFNGLEANSYYEFKIVFAVNNETADPDIKYSVSVPAGTIGKQYMTYYENAAVVPYSSTNILNIGAVPSGKFISANVLNETWFCMEGIFKTGNTAGTLAFQWAPNVNDPDDCIVLAGSFMFIKKYGLS